MGIAVRFERLERGGKVVDKSVLDGLGIDILFDDHDVKGFYTTFKGHKEPLSENFYGFGRVRSLGVDGGVVTDPDIRGNELVRVAPSEQKPFSYTKTLNEGIPQDGIYIFRYTATGNNR